MLNNAPNRYYLPPEFDLRKKVMQIYDDKIIISDRPDFSYDHVWKPFVIIGIYLLSFFLRDLMAYIQIAVIALTIYESIREPDNRLTRFESKFLIFQRVVALGVLFFFGFKLFLGYIILTEMCFYLRLKFLKREEPVEYMRTNIHAISFNEGSIFSLPLITISYFDHHHSLKSASYTFANDAELGLGKIALTDTKVIS
jgi:hypothetical protein